MVIGTELGNGLGEIVADCALGESQLGGDLGVRTAVARSLEDLALTVSSWI
jgi:hypothetical protein